MRALTLAFLVLASFPLYGEAPKYLVGEVTLPEGALAELPARAEALGIPSLIHTQDGPQFIGVQDEPELLAAFPADWLDPGSAAGKRKGRVDRGRQHRRPHPPARELL